MSKTIRENFGSAQGASDFAARLRSEGLADPSSIKINRGAGGFYVTYSPRAASRSNESLGNFWDGIPLGSLPDLGDVSSSVTGTVGSDILPLLLSFISDSAISGAEAGGINAEAYTALLEQFGAPIANSLLSIQLSTDESLRNANINAAMQHAPNVRRAFDDSLDPNILGLRGQVTDHFSERVAAGPNLTPHENRAVQQSARSADVARGVGGGQGGANREAVIGATAAMKDYDEIIRDAATFVNQHHVTTPDVFSATRVNNSIPGAVSGAVGGFIPTMNIPGFGDVSSLLGQVQNQQNNQFDFSKYLSGVLAQQALAGASMNSPFGTHI